MKALFSFLALLSFFLPTLPAQDTHVSSKSLSAIGTIVPKHTSILSSRVSGRILEVLVDAGDEVKKGDILLKIDPLFFEIDVALAEAERTSAKVSLADAELHFQRMSKLWHKPEGISPSISKKQFEDANVRYEQEKAHLQEAEESLKKAKANLDETLVKAPYDGIITKRLVHPGESVSEDATKGLIEIESIDQVYIEFSIPQTALSDVHAGSPFTFVVDGAPQEKHEATIALIYPHIDEKTRSAKCRATIDNAKRKLTPGALVHIHLARGA